MTNSRHVRSIRPAALLVLLLAVQACSPGDQSVRTTTVATAEEHDETDSVAIAGVVEQFHSALAAADSVLVAALLASEAMILESGTEETKEEYLSHHFHSDAAFLGATTREPATQHIRLAGDAAWVGSTARIFGTLRGRDVDVDFAELIILRRKSDEWHIAAIHWSSRSRNR